MSDNDKTPKGPDALHERLYPLADNYAPSVDLLPDARPALAEMGRGSLMRRITELENLLEDVERAAVRLIDRNRMGERMNMADAAIGEIDNLITRARMNGIVKSPRP